MKKLLLILPIIFIVGCSDIGYLSPNMIDDMYSLCGGKENTAYFYANKSSSKLYKNKNETTYNVFCKDSSKVEKTFTYDL